MFKTSKIRIACLILLLSVHTAAHCISKGGNYKIKTIVLDAGHGGHDTGCNGPSHSYEKDVTLKIILGLGKLIEENYPDIKVLYSRKTDVFITLQDRALLANKNNADLFLSVHCNANPNKSAYGTETYLMGLHVSQANLDVARRENSVIKLEKNYQKTYEGFDPDSPEAMIALSLNQNANIEQSTFLASKVQESLTTKLNRFNRGVKQAGFWVLYRTTCPSILIETGFLTNKTEEKYLTSKSGEEELSNAIFRAFEEYKNTVEKGGKLTPPVITNTGDNYIKDDKDDDDASDIPTVDSPEKTNAPVFPKSTTKERSEPVTKKESSSKKIAYKVQIKATTKPLPKSDKAFKLMGALKYEKVKGSYKYLAGPYDSYDMAQKMVKKAKRGGYKDAFVVVYKNGERLSFNEAKQYFK